MHVVSSVVNHNSQLASPSCLSNYQHMRRVMAAGLIAALVSALTTLGNAPGSENANMRAVVIHAYGGPEVMKLEQVTRPEPAEDEVLVGDVAASINSGDVAIRKGYLAKLVSSCGLIL